MLDHSKKMDHIQTLGYKKNVDQRELGRYEATQGHMEFVNLPKVAGHTEKCHTDKICQIDRMCQTVEGVQGVHVTPVMSVGKFSLSDKQ